MSLTFGYDLKDDDKILEAPNKLSSILRPLIIPGRGALIDTLPFCAISQFLSCIPVVSHGCFQYGTFLHGSHSSATNH